MLKSSLFKYLSQVYRDVISLDTTQEMQALTSMIDFTTLSLRKEVQYFINVVAENILHCTGTS